MKLTWSAPGDRFFESGVDRGVMYRDDRPGVAWNGLQNVSVNPVGGEAVTYYIDGVPYINVASRETFQGTLEAYTYPDEFMECDGTYLIDNGFFGNQQPRKQFGITFRTLIGNDVKGTDYGYKIHLLYNLLATPSQKQYQSLGEIPEPTAFSWDLSGLPIFMPGLPLPSVHFVIDSTKNDGVSIKTVENVLYGSPGVEPRLPSPTEIVELLGIPVLEIHPNYLSGVGTLSQTGEQDLMLIGEGIYIRPPESRLIQTEDNGIYTLDED